jgi:hypothetical protein
LAEDGDHTIADEMDEIEAAGLHGIEVRDNNVDPADAVLEIKYRRILVLPPIGKQNIWNGTRCGGRSRIEVFRKADSKFSRCAEVKFTSCGGDQPVV